MTEHKRSSLSHFDSYEDQERRDLDYGEQTEECRRFAQSTPIRYGDHSIKRDWTPDED